MNPKRYSNEKAKRGGFYLALAICLVAVGIAAWSTYDAVQEYLTPQGETASQAVNQSGLQEKQNEDVLKGQQSASLSPEDKEDPETLPKQDTPPSSASCEESSALETAGKIDTKGPSGTEDSLEEKTTAPLYERSDELIFPVQSQAIACAYSAGAPVYSQTMKDWRIHTGADLTAQGGEAVLACGNGIVKGVYTDMMLGNVVWAEHGDYDFYYCGLGEDFLVKQGDVISKGQQLGVITAVPMESAENPHLHLEVKKDGVSFDPIGVIEGKD